MIQLMNHRIPTTCGGLCPGLNNVIWELTKTLHQLYGIGGKVYGIQGGYRGFYDHETLPPVILTPELVENILHSGGTCLGSSRGGFDLDKIYNLLQTIKPVNCTWSVVTAPTEARLSFTKDAWNRDSMWRSPVFPKTINNDLDLIDHSFGRSSAIKAACLSIRSAKTEAVCNLPNGIGIIKLMGQSTGFIAAHACMASSDVDLCLVPEVPVVLEGEYIDLSYTVRSVPANAADSLYCMQLAQNAIHGAMAGYTGFSVGLCNNCMVFLPIPELVATSPGSMDPRGQT
jgi:6-phosphofructokinase 1